MILFFTSLKKFRFFLGQHDASYVQNFDLLKELF